MHKWKAHIEPAHMHCQFLMFIIESILNRRVLRKKE